LKGTQSLLTDPPYSQNLNGHEYKFEPRRIDSAEQNLTSRNSNLKINLTIDF